MSEALSTSPTESIGQPSQELMAQEYQQGIELLRHFSGVRRQDIVFVTTAQAAILTVIGKSLPRLDLAQYALTFIAFYVIILGINTERRLAAYSDGYVTRLKLLEPMLGIALLSAGAAEVDRRRFLASNKRMFLTYYGLLLAGWIALWISNLADWFTV